MPAGILVSFKKYEFRFHTNEKGKEEWNHGKSNN